LLFVIFGVIGASSSPAWAQEVEAGFDLFMTTETTQVDLTGFGLGIIPLEGDETFFGIPGVDTIVQRLEPAGVPNPGDSNEIPIELLALSLRSIEPVDLGEIGMFDLHVAGGSELFPQDVGSMLITRDNPNGGSFEAMLPVNAVLQFTEVDGDGTKDFVVPFEDQFTSQGVWSDEYLFACQVPGLDDGNFFPGVDPNTMEKVLTVEEAAFAKHSVLPCMMMPPSDPTPDHYFSYVVNEKTVPEFEKFSIGLADQFGADLYSVVKPIRMYNPVQKNDEPINDFETHLKAYKIRGETPEVQNLVLINQFEEIDVDIKRVDSLLLSTAKSHTGPTDPLTDSLVDDFKCYRVNVNERIGNGGGVSKNPVFIADPNFKELRLVKVTGKPLLCNPVAKLDPMTGQPLSEIKNPDVHLACYNVKPLKGDEGHTKIRFDTNNQFGPEDLITKRHDVELQSGKVLKHEICVPTIKVHDIPG